jgi:hypothetical protein
MAEFDSGRVNAPADHTTSCFERGDGPWGALGALLRATPEAARQPANGGGAANDDYGRPWPRYFL